MGNQFHQLSVLEVEYEDGEWPMVYGKGRRKDDLVYFQLDANFLRKPDQIREGGLITITDDEVVGIAKGHF